MLPDLLHGDESKGYRRRRLSGPDPGGRTARSGPDLPNQAANAAGSLFACKELQGAGRNKVTQADIASDRLWLGNHGERI